MPVDLIEEIKTIAHDMAARVEESDKEQKARGEELTSKVGLMAGEFKDAFDRQNARINELEELNRNAQVAAARPPFSDGNRKQRSAHHQAFVKAMKARGDIHALTAEERAMCVKEYMPEGMKAMYAADATTGGFFASTDFINELIQYRLLISPMRSICRQMTTSGERVQMPALSQDTTAYWATEQAAFTNSNDPTVGMVTIPVHELRGLLRISQQNLEDSMFNLEDLIKTRLMMQFAKTEGAAFLNGTGAGQPRGLLNYPTVASSSLAGGSAGKNNVTNAVPYVASTGVTGKITPDDILNIFMDLKSYYAPNATYVFTRATLNSIRLMKDAQQRPLWQPFAAASLPSTIYDRPYVEMPDMPEIASGNFCVAVGDFSQYLIVDRITLNIQQLNELYIASGLIGFIARMRVGGDLLLPEAVRLLKVN